MPQPAKAPTPAALRAWWSAKQGLDGSLAGAAPGAVLARAGWSRSVGGAAPYLTLQSRADLSREAVDASVAGLEIYELPSARACTYVLPAEDFAFALKLASLSGGDNEMRVARKLGVTDAEIENLCVAVVSSLKKGPREPESIREACGGKVRNFGPEGAKKGLTTTLPIALGKLQLTGDIRRIPANGRLDQQRYRYTLWQPNPLNGFKLADDQAFITLARKYFEWIGPATVAEFQWFSGLGVKAAKAAVEPLGLVPLHEGSDRLISPRDRDALLSFKPPKDPCYSLVSSLDGIVLHRRDVRSLVEDSDLEREVVGEKGLRHLGGLTDLPSHGIFDRGRLIGLWEYDTTAGEIVWMSFSKPDAALKAEVRRVEEYVRTQLGDARSFSLDSPKSRAPRLAAIRKLAAC